MILILVGTSGSGKSTLENKLINDSEMNFKKVVTVTTRLPRNNELPGDDYYFIEKPWFDALIKYGILHDPKKYGNNYYACYQVDSNELLKDNSNYVCIFTADKAVRWKKQNIDDVCIIEVISPGFSQERIDEINSRTSEDKKLVQILNDPDYILYNEEGKLEDTYQELKGYIKKFTLKRCVNLCAWSDIKSKYLQF